MKRLISALLSAALILNIPLSANATRSGCTLQQMEDTLILQSMVMPVFNCNNRGETVLPEACGGINPFYKNFLRGRARWYAIKKLNESARTESYAKLRGEDAHNFAADVFDVICEKQDKYCLDKEISGFFGKHGGKVAFGAVLFAGPPGWIYASYVAMEDAMLGCDIEDIYDALTTEAGITAVALVIPTVRLSKGSGKGLLSRLFRRSADDVADLRVTRTSPLKNPNPRGKPLNAKEVTISKAKVKPKPKSRNAPRGNRAPANPKFRDLTRLGVSKTLNSNWSSNAWTHIRNGIFNSQTGAPRIAKGLHTLSGLKEFLGAGAVKALDITQLAGGALKAKIPRIHFTRGAFNKLPRKNKIGKEFGIKYLFPPNWRDDQIIQAINYVYEYGAREGRQIIATVRGVKIAVWVDDAADLILSAYPI
ncbi:hypothetical protein ACFL6Y_08190 [Elusimicrobiota bacterium]